MDELIMRAFEKLNDDFLNLEKTFDCDNGYCYADHRTRLAYYQYRDGYLEAKRIYS